MKALVITGGTLSKSEILEKYNEAWDIVICADSGAHYALDNNIVPNILMGDFDSIEPELLQHIKKNNVKIQCFPVEKDYTDTHIAINYAIDKGAKSIVILGGIGTRIDHTLANISLMASLIQRDISCTMENDYCKVYMSSSYIEVEGNIGDIVSILPITEKVTGINIKGFKYPIENGTMEIGNPYGVSNVLISNKGIIEHDTGLLAVIFAKD